MDELLDALINSQRLAQVSSDLVGRVLGLQWAVVYRTDDPLGLHRIQVMEPRHGGKSTSDWLMRLTPYQGLSLPLPRPNDTVLVGYVDGNPHQGCYLGVVFNQVNQPQGDGSILVLSVGQGQLTLKPSGELALDGFTSVTINGQQVVTVGGRDTRRDTIVERGW